MPRLFQLILIVLCEALTHCLTILNHFHCGSDSLVHNSVWLNVCGTHFLRLQIFPLVALVCWYDFPCAWFFFETILNFEEKKSSIDLPIFHLIYFMLEFFLQPYLCNDNCDKFVYCLLACEKIVIFMIWCGVQLFIIMCKISCGWFFLHLFFFLNIVCNYINVWLCYPFSFFFTRIILRRLCHLSRLEDSTICTYVLQHFPLWNKKTLWNLLLAFCEACPTLISPSYNWKIKY
jgi:hypothetical protein